MLQDGGRQWHERCPVIDVEEDCQWWVWQGGEVIGGQRYSDHTAATEDVVSRAVSLGLEAVGKVRDIADT